MTTKMGIEVKSIPSFRDTRGRFVSAEKALLEGMRGGMRDQGRRLWEMAVKEAPESEGLTEPFDPGAFKRAIRWHSFNTGNELGVRITMPQPLGRYIVLGTTPHPIAARSANMLFFYWQNAPSELGGADWYHFQQVQHPGTKPNPFTGRAYRRWLPGARKFLQSISRTYVRTLHGSSKSF